MDIERAVPRDAIPSVDTPSFGTTYFGAPTDDVIVFDRVDPARAYPIRILHHHEIVNDRVEDGPIVVTWCPLCGSAVGFSRHLGGRALTFGVSGKLADDDLIMYDRETESEWKQTTGECIAGPLAGSTLTPLPITLTTWTRFHAQYPNGVVLQPPGGRSETASPDDTPAPIDYGRHPYAEYFADDGFGLAAHRGTGGRTWDREDIDPKATVIGIEFDGEALGIPVTRVYAENRVVSVRVGTHNVLVLGTPDGVHAFEDPGIDFDPVDSHRFRGAGALWDATTGTSDDGRRLDRVPIRRVFAFAWQDDHGPTASY